MAGEAAIREFHEIALLSVDVVAGGAGHQRGTEASAPFQQRHLVAVYIHGARIASCPPLNLPLERLPRYIGESGCAWRRHATVTERASIQLSRARQPCRVDDCGR